MSGNINIFADADIAPLGESEESLGLSYFDNAVPKRITVEYERRVDELLKYASLAENVQDINDEAYRIKLFSKLSYGLRKSSEALSWALLFQKESVRERKEAESIALLDDFGNYLIEKKNEGKDIKATDTMRKAYVHINPRVKVAYQKEAVADAFVNQFSSLRSEFFMALSSLKSMAYGYRDADHLSSAASTEPTGD